jgi:hypothetical protein
MTETETIIQMFEKSLERYKIELKKNPESTFYKGIVKNTEEYIYKLKNDIPKK